MHQRNKHRLLGRGPTNQELTEALRTRTRNSGSGSEQLVPQAPTELTWGHLTAKGLVSLLEAGRGPTRD